MSIRITGSVQIKSDFSIEELGAVISMEILGDIKLEGLEHGIYDEIPAIYNNVFGFKVVLQGFSGRDHEIGFVFSLVPDSGVPGKQEIVDISEYLEELFKEKLGPATWGIEIVERHRTFRKKIQNLYSKLKTIFTRNQKLNLSTQLVSVLPEKLRHVPRLILKDRRLALLGYKPENFLTELHNGKGASEGWLSLNVTDSFIFRADRGTLNLLYLRYPEVNLKPENIHLLQEAQKQTGIPFFKNHIPDFKVPEQPFRYFDTDRNLLLCFGEEFRMAKSFLELEIARDTSLFFSEGQYCGWGLYEPGIYMTEGFELSDSFVPPGFLNSFLSKAFDLVVTENVEKMEAKDAAVFEKLNNLYHSIVSHRLHPEYRTLVALSNWLQDLGNKFYDKTLL